MQFMEPMQYGADNVKANAPQVLAKTIQPTLCMCQSPATEIAEVKLLILSQKSKRIWKQNSLGSRVSLARRAAPFTSCQPPSSWRH